MSNTFASFDHYSMHIVIKNNREDFENVNSLFFFQPMTRSIQLSISFS